VPIKTKREPFSATTWWPSPLSFFLSGTPRVRGEFDVLLGRTSSRLDTVGWFQVQVALPPPQECGKRASSAFKSDPDIVVQALSNSRLVSAPSGPVFYMRLRGSLPPCKLFSLEHAALPWTGACGSNSGFFESALTLPHLLVLRL
jgi:hypothetical protein